MITIDISTMKIKTTFALAALAMSSSCAVLKAGDYASEAFMREPDPAMAEAALPTMIKASEALSLADPKSESKAISTASLYLMYANAFLEGESFLLPDEDFDRKRSLSTRASGLYGRAFSLLSPFVEKRLPGLFALDYGPYPGSRAPLSRFGKNDVPLLYWTAASVLAGFAADPMDFDNASRVAGALAMFERATELEPGWNGGALHELGITIYSSLPAELGGDMRKARAAFAAATANPLDRSPGAYVAYAYSICVKAGDKPAFEAALAEALSMPSRPETALMDALARRKAQKLIEDIRSYF